MGGYNYEDYHIHSLFGVAQPLYCLGVPSKILSQRSTWNKDEKYYETAFKLSITFRENFKKFEAYANEKIGRGGLQRYAY